MEADYVRVGPTQQGLLTSVAVARGDRVEPGSLLFTQDEANDRAARDEAAARLAEAEARLANLRATSRPTEIAQAEAELAELQAARDRAEKDLYAGGDPGADRRRHRATGGPDARRRARRRRPACRRPRRSSSRCARPRDGRRRSRPRSRSWTGRAPSWRRPNGGLTQRRVVSPVAALVAEVYARAGETLGAGAPVVSLLPPRISWSASSCRRRRSRASIPACRSAVGCDTCPAGLHGRDQLRVAGSRIHAAGDLQRMTSAASSSI